MSELISNIKIVKAYLQGQRAAEFKSDHRTVHAAFIHWAVWLLRWYSVDQVLIGYSRDVCPSLFRIMAPTQAISYKGMLLAGGSPLSLPHLPTDTLTTDSSALL